MNIKITSHCAFGSPIRNISFHFNYGFLGKGTEEEPYTFKGVDYSNSDFSISIYDSQKHILIDNFRFRMIELSNCTHITIINCKCRTIEFLDCHFIKSENLKVSKKLTIEKSQNIKINKSKISKIESCEKSSGIIQESLLRKIFIKNQEEFLIKDSNITSKRKEFLII